MRSCEGEARRRRPSTAARTPSPVHLPQHAFALARCHVEGALVQVVQVGLAEARGVAAPAAPAGPARRVPQRRRRPGAGQRHLHLRSYGRPAQRHAAARDGRPGHRPRLLVARGRHDPGHARGVTDVHRSSRHARRRLELLTNSSIEGRTQRSPDCLATIRRATSRRPVASRLQLVEQQAGPEAHRARGASRGRAPGCREQHAVRPAGGATKGGPTACRRARAAGRRSAASAGGAEVGGAQTAAAGGARQRPQLAAPGGSPARAGAHQPERPSSNRNRRQWPRTRARVAARGAVQQRRQVARADRLGDGGALVGRTAAASARGPLEHGRAARSSTGRARAAPAAPAPPAAARSACSSATVRPRRGGTAAACSFCSRTRAAVVLRQRAPLW